MTGKTPNRWVLQSAPKPGARLRLFCLPYAGGGAQIFRGWADGLPAVVEVCPIQLPGRESRMKEERFSQVSPLVQAIVPALLPFLDMPFVFFGHSMGALIAFELARELRRQNRTDPSYLIVSGRGAPQLPLERAAINRLPEPLFIDALKRLNGTPEAVLENPDLMKLVLPLLRSDFSVNEEYSYLEAPPLACPLMAMGGLNDTEASREAIEAWRAQTSGSFIMRMLPGDHFFLTSAQPLFLRILSQELHQLARALG
ncbi:MAG: putative thioesterase [Blastocatellia bacterium AA13]|nr:MAG: putative thioesterase [Blastocatellia bacterium AA13]